MENKFYLISEEELINLLQNKKNMSICLENNLINPKSFGLAFIKWLAEDLTRYNIIQICDTI